MCVGRQVVGGQARYGIIKASSHCINSMLDPFESPEALNDERQDTTLKDASHPATRLDMSRPTHAMESVRKGTRLAYKTVQFHFVTSLVQSHFVKSLLSNVIDLFHSGEH